MEYTGAGRWWEEWEVEGWYVAWSKKLLFKNVFTVWLARIAVRLESSVFTPVERVCSPRRFIWRRRNRRRRTGACSHPCCYPRVRVCKHRGRGARARPKEAASPFPGLRRGLSNLFGYSPRRRGRKLQPLWNSTTLAVHSIVVNSTVASN